MRPLLNVAGIAVGAALAHYVAGTSEGSMYATTFIGGAFYLLGYYHRSQPPR